MTSKPIYGFKPTYLYIKQHSITGKLYFGKTTKDPEKYQGSGKEWLKHIKINGREYVETLWYCLFLDEESCTSFALNFSAQQNIVESEDWMNLKNESGIDGTIPGSTLSLEHRAKIAASMKGRPSPQRGRSPWNKGKPASQSSKDKLSESTKGFRWFTNGVENRRCRECPDGFRPGMMRGDL